MVPLPGHRCPPACDATHKPNSSLAVHLHLLQRPHRTLCVLNFTPNDNVSHVTSLDSNTNKALQTYDNVYMNAGCMHLHSTSHGPTRSQLTHNCCLTGGTAAHCYTQHHPPLHLSSSYNAKWYHSVPSWLMEGTLWEDTAYCEVGACAADCFWRNRCVHSPTLELATTPMMQAKKCNNADDASKKVYYTCS